MGKAEEYRAKKRNKAARKRLSNTVDFTQGIQAAKRRRKAGRRRICEGMCFSLPTADDPFNDLYKEKLAKKKAKRDLENGDDITDIGIKKASKVESHKKELKERPHKPKRSNLSANYKKTKKAVSVVGATQRSEDKDPDGSLNKVATDGFASRNGLKDAVHEESSRETFKWKPSWESCAKKEGSWTCMGEDAFERALCALLNAGVITEERHENKCVGALNRKAEVCMGGKWDRLFWEACGTGLDILVTGSAANACTLANSALVAVSHVSARKAHQILFSSPVVLFIVQSKEQTLQARSIFKVLKPVSGLHSVSLHTGTSLQHQIEGLKSTPAEILVATPDRLCDLLSVNAISLSNVSFLMVDGLEGLFSCGFSDQLVHIREKVAHNVQSVLSSGNIPHSMYAICQKLLAEPIRRVMADTSVSQCSTWISQNVQVLVSEERRQRKLHKIIRDHFENRESGATTGGLLVLFRQAQVLSKMKAAIQEEGYSADCFVGDSITKNHGVNPVLEQFRNGQVEVLLSTEEYTGEIDVAAVGTVIYYEFPSTMDLYSRILTSMARHCVRGTLYSFCSGAMAPLALQLVEVLEQCFQPVPSSLKMLAKAAILVKQRKP